MDTFSKSSLRKAIAGTRDLENDSGIWTHKNGRSFDIEWSGSTNQHFIKERVPSGRLASKNHSEYGAITVLFSDDQSLPDRFYSDPNGLGFFVKTTHGENAEAIRYSPSIDIKRIRTLTEDEAVEAISACILTNRRFLPPLLDLDLTCETMSNLACKKNSEDVDPSVKKSLHSQAVPWLFRGLGDKNGPLAKENRDRILAHLNRPSVETWDEVARITITTTLRFHSPWSTWVYLRPLEAQCCLTEGAQWDKFPDKDTFLLILEYARKAGETLDRSNATTPEDALRASIRKENLIRRQIGMPDLSPKDIEAAMGDVSAWSHKDQREVMSPRKIC